MKFDAQYVPCDIGWEFWCKEGNALPDRTVKALQGTTCGLFGAITAQVRARELLFPVLLLPAQVPVLLGAVSATEIVLAGQPLAEAAQWLKLLAAADVVYLVVGLLTFEFVLEGA